MVVAEAGGHVGLCGDRPRWTTLATTTMTPGLSSVHRGSSSWRASEAGRPRSSLNPAAAADDNDVDVDDDDDDGKQNAMDNSIRDLQRERTNRL